MAFMKKRKVINTEIVGESQKTKRARDKLKQRMALMEEKMTPEALKDKTSAIERWIDRRASERVPVKKNIALFDKNQNSAKSSKGVARLQEELEQQLQ